MLSLKPPETGKYYIVSVYNSEMDLITQRSYKWELDALRFVELVKTKMPYCVRMYCVDCNMVFDQYAGESNVTGISEIVE